MTTPHTKPRTKQQSLEERILCDASSALLDHIYALLEEENKDGFFTKRLVKITRQAFRDYYDAMRSGSVAQERAAAKETP